MVGLSAKVRIDATGWFPSCEKRHANAIGTADSWGSADGVGQTASARTVIGRKAAAYIDFDQAVKLAGMTVTVALANRRSRMVQAMRRYGSPDGRPDAIVANAEGEVASERFSRE
jgi:hypothetical protein